MPCLHNCGTPERSANIDLNNFVDVLRKHHRRVEDTLERLLAGEITKPEAKRRLASSKMLFKKEREEREC